MNYIDFKTEKGEFRIIDFPENSIVEQFGGQILYKQPGENFANEYPPLAKGYLELISKISDLNMETIFDKIAPYNFKEIFGKRFIDSFINPNEVTIDEEVNKNPQTKHYKFLANPYIFKIKS